jgi:hypothetical protein
LFLYSKKDNNEGGRVMSEKIKKIVHYLFFYGMFFITLSVLEAQFKTYWPGKEVHVSTASSKFLKKMTVKFQAFLDEKSKTAKNENPTLASYRSKILNMLHCFATSNPICGTDIEYLGQSIFNARAPLIMTIKSGPSEQKSKLQNSLIKEIGFDLSQALKEVYIGTAKSDLAQIREFLNNPKRDQVIYIYGLIQEIISHFDAVAVTEYDFMVLSECALFVLLLID